MKLKELLSLSIFKKSTLLTGDIGLDNEVDSAMVLEAVDIENWGRENQLILTSYYAFQTLTTENEWDTFFSTINKMGISGIAIKIDRLIRDIPKQLIENCVLYNIPLIKINSDTSYEKIMLSIFEPILHLQGNLLRTYYEARQRFSTLEKNSASLEEVISIIHELTNSTCQLEVTDLDINICKGDTFENYVVTNREYIKPNDFTKNTYNKINLLSPDHSHEIIAIESEIITPFSNKCTLIVYQLDEWLIDSQLMLIENAIDSIHDSLNRIHQRKKERFNKLNKIADAILQNTPDNKDELNNLLDAANLNFFAYYQGLIFPHHTLSKDNVYRNLLRKLRSLRKDSLYFEHYNYTVILFNINHTDDKIDSNEIRSLLNKFELSTKNFSIAISDLKEKEWLKEIFLECLSTIQFNDNFYIDCVVSSNDLGIFKHFIEDPNKLESLIPQNLITLYHNNFTNFETLYTFFVSGRNYNKTAETLFIHPKTVRYRMRKIEESLHLDFNNSFKLLSYEVGTYLLHLKKQGHHNR